MGKQVVLWLSIAIAVGVAVGVAVRQVRERARAPKQDASRGERSMSVPPAPAPPPTIVPPAPPGPVAVPAVEVTALKLYAAYHDNEVGADARYRDKMLRVAGRIESIGKDVMDQPYVAFVTANEYASVQAVFDRDDDLIALRRGQRLTVRCRGKGMMLGNPIIDSCALDLSPADVAHANAMTIAVDAYGEWAADHPRRACPRDAGELSRYVKVTYDPWGEQFRVFCNPTATRGKRMRAASNGPDRKPDTADDIKSWQ